MAEHFDKNLLQKIMQAHFPGEEYTFERTPTGHFSTTYFVDSSDRQFVLRIAPVDDRGFLFYEKRMMAQEPEMHRLVLENTDCPIPRILAYDDSRKLVDRDYLIMDRLPGVPANHAPWLTGSAWNGVLYQVGKCLRQVHELKADKYGYLGEHHPMEPQDNWLSAFRVMWNKLLDDVHGTGHYDDDETARMRRLLETHIRHFDRPVDSSLLHMDIWSQNILVDGSNLTGVIDWDRACWGDPEIEFAILDYCGISEPSFWEGYGMQRDMSESAQIRRIFYLLYEVQKYIVIYHWRDGDAAKCLRYKRQSMEMARVLQ